ncbi:MAG: nitrile hydratase subunit alpha [Actinomycetota bacterium]
MSDDHDDAQLSRQVRALETLLERRDLVDSRGIDQAVEAYLARATAANGARIVARAWVDPGFAGRLLTDANTAVEEVGASMRGGIQTQRLRVVANTDRSHNVVTCTLCSCYPVALLGPSPSWYKSEAYRSRIVREPRGVLAEFGLTLADGIDITVWDSTSESRYLVLPARPAGTDALTETELSGLVTRNGMIGTAAV